MSNVSLLPLCSNPKIAIRDGWTGVTAKLLLPFYKVANGSAAGLYTYWFADGSQLAFNGSTVPQDSSLTMNGTTKPNTFVKDAGVCLQG